MRVLLWSTNYYPYIGGIERLVHNLACDLTEQGHQVLVLTDAPSQSQAINDEIDGISVLRLPLSHALLAKKLPLMKQNLERVNEVVGTFKPDIVHIHGWYETMAFYQYRVAENSSVPFFLTVHGLLEQEHYNTLACQRLWSLCPSVSVVSHALKDDLLASGITHPDMRLIYNGSRLSEKPLVHPSGTVKTLVCVGRLSPEKGFDTAIRAFALLQESHPGLKLIIAGGGPLYTVLADLIEALGIQDQVQLLDYVPPPEVDALLDQADIVLMPSSYESFGLVAAEAALRGRPVIAGKVDGLKEVVLDGETGLLVPPDDPEALSGAMRQLLDNPTHVANMGKNGYRRALENFSLPTMTANYLAMYRGERGAY